MDPMDMMVVDYNCEYLGLSRLCLMENAGKSISDEVATLSTFKFSKPVKIIIFTGSGGNGGDGFVAARHLLNRGFSIELCCLNKIDEIKSENAVSNLQILMNLAPRVSRLSIKFIEDSEDLKKLKFNKSNSEFIILDCLLGTGIKGKLRSKVRKTVEFINECSGLKVSIDVPSGLNPLTGEIPDIAVNADYTVSFHKVKKGIKLAGEEKVGSIITCDIGIPFEAELYVEGGDLLRLNNRLSNSHKGNNGKVLIVGGSKDYYGAPAIAAKASIASGVDLNYIYTSNSSANPIKSLSEDFIVMKSQNDYLSLDDLDDILDLAEDVDAVLLGPGSGQESETSKLFNVLVMKIQKPLVLDADALKLVDYSLISKKDDLIITPHFAEFKSFFKNQIPPNIEVNLDKLVNLNDEEYLDSYKFNNKIDTIHSISKSIEGSVILKGQYDLIFKGNKLKINRTGNPGMTVGGSGDALAGIAVSLLAQGLNNYDSAILAPYINGKAGNLALESQGYGFGAQDLTHYIGIVMSNLID